ncbi:MAG TPA: NUDIX domain-containing protein [Burkholderiaceae bacterium]|nr:NUDIX domain-containing protein [Burkholderiaceae bacterium]
MIGHKKSAGILPYRLRDGRLQVLLVHPGGPFWARKDSGAWSIGKGEYGDDENPFEAALREFEEETGHRPAGTFVPLEPIKMPSGKWVSAWAVDDAWDLTGFRSNKFPLEWPRGSGRMQAFDEVDKVQWLDLSEAATRIVPAQRGFLVQLARQVLSQGLPG